jgi:hypothetical protein
MANPIDAANKYRQAIGSLMAAYEKLIGINEEYVALDIGNNVVDADFPDITQVQFTDGVAAAQTIITTIETNDANLYRVSDGSQRS